MNPQSADPVAIAVLAKAPVAGLAKTRLIPALGAHGAAVLAERFIERTIGTAISSALGPVTVWTAPDSTHAVFRQLAVQHRIAFRHQPDGDLGMRMLAAMIEARGPVLVIGTDCPGLTVDHLQLASFALQGGNDAVIAPAQDGGYVLIGVRRPMPELLSDIAWSTPQVMAETRRRIELHGFRAHELPKLWDVDEPADLKRLEREFPDLAP